MKRSGQLIALAALASAALLPLSGAEAQLAGNSKAPILINADSLEARDAERVQIWTGDVDAVQETTRLRSSKLTIYYAPKPPGAAPTQSATGIGGGWGDPQRMVAEGPVYYVTPQQQARGNSAVYDLAGNTITMIGDVVVAQQENVVRGDTLVINTQTGAANVVSTTKGRGAPKRVQGVFYNTDKPAAGQPAAPVAPARPGA